MNGHFPSFRRCTRGRRRPQVRHCRHWFRSTRVEPLEPRLVLGGLTSVDYGQVSPAWFATVPQVFTGAEATPFGTGSTDPAAARLSAPASASRWIVRLTEAAVSELDSVRETEWFLDSLTCDFQVIRGLGLPGQALVRAFGTADQARAALSGNPHVSSFELEVRQSGQRVPDDPQFGQLLGLENTGQTGGTPDADIDATAAWNITTGSREVVVAVLDTGIDTAHPDLAGNLWTNPGEVPGNRIDDDHNGFVDDVHGYDFLENDGTPLDQHGHGTHVAGTIGAVGNNGQGVTGVAWSTSLLALRFLDADNQGFLSDAVRAVNYATMLRTTQDVNVRVLNASWGSEVYNQALRDAVGAAGAAGILVVAAAGNGDALGRGMDNDEEPFYPASFNLPNIVAVAATGQNDELARFSNYGPTSVDLAAPGVGILSTTLGGAYASRNGTSMAAPHGAGTAALVWSLLPDATVDEVRAALLEGADPLDGLADRVATGGRLNAYRALTVDTYAPRVTQTVVADVAQAGGMEQLITVTFRDNVALNAASLDNRDVAVTSLSGQPFDALAEFVSLGSVAGGGQSVVYRLTPPGGQWDSADNGAYQVSLQPGQVTDLAGNAAWPQVLGTFTVEVAVAGAVTVNTVADTVDAAPGDGESRDADGKTSLRAAVMEANAALGLDTIVLPAGHYTLTLAGRGEDAAASGDLDITESLNIRGAGAAATIIDAAGLDRVFEILPDITVNLWGVTVTGGLSDTGGVSDAGGGLRNRGTLILEDAVVTGNCSTGAGGGLLNEGTLTVRRTTVSQNTAALSGGGIRNAAGTLTVTDSTLAGNQTQVSGGGIHSSLGTVTVTNSTFSGNTGATSGGAVHLASGSLSLTNATITANAAADGGGLAVAAGAAARPYNTIIAANTATGTANPDLAGAFNSGGNNLIGNAGAATGFADGVKQDQVGTAAAVLDPQLGPLQDNGGPTPTHALRIGSPAIDAANGVFAPAADQRGTARPEDGDNNGTATADIGAFEFVLFAEIHGVKFRDLNENGVRDPGEPGLAGFTVFLDENDDGALDPSELRTVTATDDPATTGTDETGTYSFAGLLPGRYLVAEDQQNGWVQTHPYLDPNQPPVISAPADPTTDEDVELIFSQAAQNAITLDDPDAGDEVLHVTITLSHGTLSLASAERLAFSGGDGTADTNLSFFGTPADINRALDGARFAPEQDFFGTAALHIAADDLGNNGSGGPQTSSETVAITVNPVNDPPTNTVPGGLTTYANSPLAITGVSLSDVDAAYGDVLKVTLSVTKGRLSLSAVSGLSFDVGDGTDDVQVVFRGTLADMNAALSGMIITPRTDFIGSAAVDLVTDDLGQTGQGGSRTDADTVQIDVLPINAAPTVDPIPDAAPIPEDAAEQTITLTGISAGGNAVQNLSVSAATTTPDLLRDLAVVYHSPETTATLSFTPVANANGVATVTVTVRDDGGTVLGGIDETSRSFQIPITPGEDPPAPAADRFTLAKDSTNAVLNVLANDRDPDGDALTIVSVGVPDQGGDVRINVDHLEYTSAAGFEGLETFEYIVRDPAGNTGTARVTATVHANDDVYDVNHDGVAAPSDVLAVINYIDAFNAEEPPEVPPRVDAASADVTRDGYVSPLDVLTVSNYLNDTQDRLTCVCGEGPPATVDPTGRVAIRLEVTDPAGQPISTVPLGGTFQVRAYVTDATDVPQGVFAAHVDLAFDADLVNGLPNQSPLGSAIAFGPDYGKGHSGKLEARRVERVGAYRMSSFAHPGSAELLLFSITFQATAGGRATFTSHSTKTSPCTDTLTYGRYDPIAPENIQFGSVSIPISEPLTLQDDTPTVAKDSVGNVLPVLTNDLPIALTITAVGATAHGTATIAADQRQLLYTPHPGFVGTDTFSYTATNAAGASQTAQVTITVSGPNDPPLARDDVFVVDQNSDRNVLTVLANDRDPNEDGLTITAVQARGDGWAAVEDGELRFSPAKGFDGLETISYSISDGLGGVATASVAVLVLPDNQVRPTSHLLRLDPGETASDVDFGNRALPGEIRGQKFHDMDGDGIKDEDEPGLQGWTIYLDQNDNGRLDADEQSTVTDADGNYAFSSLEPLTDYIVAELQQPGWQQTAPNGGSAFSSELRTLLPEEGGDGREGFLISGARAGAHLGYSVSGAGDINGDGIADVIVGAPQEGEAGAAYLIFGAQPAVGPRFNLATLDGSNGFRIPGVVSSGNLASAVSGAGDVNGDGIGDLIIGCPKSAGASGAAYVILGKRADWAASLDLSTLDGTNGFRIDGQTDENYFGASVVGGGDVNGDRVDDVLVGGGQNGVAVVFGRRDGFPSVVQTSTLNGTPGFRIQGANADSNLNAEGVCDFDGDGIEDLILSDRGASPGGREAAGEVYVIFGKRQGFAAHVSVAPLTGSDGFKIEGNAPFDLMGEAAGAGDINADGFEDLIVGAFGASPGGRVSAGVSYVIFGQPRGSQSTFDLGELDGTNGFRLEGTHDHDTLGRAIHGAGDVNGDGFADLIVGAPRSPSHSQGAGAAYILFGKSGVFPAKLDLDQLQGASGAKLVGVRDGDFTGGDVSSAGDIDRDGFDDLIIGAQNASPEDGAQAGLAFVVYGRPDGAAAKVQLGAGGVRSDVDFGNQPLPAEIHGQKFKDLDGDGVKDDGEPGLEGWSIYLDLDQSGTPGTGEPTVTTDAEGRYAFTGLAPFTTYTVAEIPQVGFEQTTPVPVQGDVSVTQFAADAKLKTLFDITTDGQNGFFVTGLDGNGSGFNSQEIFQIGPDGGTATYLAAANAPTAIAADGRYVYWSEPGDEAGAAAIYRLALDSGELARVYTVEQENPPLAGPVGLAFVPAAPPSGTLVATDLSGGRVFSMAATNPVSGATQLGPPRYGSTVERNHASFVAVADGIVYVADPGLAGFADTPPRVQAIPLTGGAFTDLYVGELETFSPQGIAVHDETIYLTNGDQILQMSTAGGEPTLLAADPRWGSLRGLEYFDGALFVIDNGDGTGATVWRVELNAPPSVTPEGAHLVTLSPGDVATGLDFGNRDLSGAGGAGETGRILGRQSLDTNGNGRQDSGEPGLAGRTVYLDLNGNGVLDPREPSTQTLADDPETPGEDETGLYVFTDLADGRYTVDVVARTGWERTAPQTIALQRKELRAGETPRAVAAGDFDADGRLDLAVANSDTNSLSLLHNLGSGMFSAGATADVGFGPAAAITGQWNDDNGDGKIDTGDRLDLAVVNSLSDSVSILLGQAGGTFAPAVHVPVGILPSAITSADLTGDGIADLAVTSDYQDSVWVLQNDGQGRFTKREDLAVDAAPQAIVAADFNGDGRPDLAVANFVSNTVSVLLYHGATGTFQAAVPVAVGKGPVALAVGDVDGDGDVDLAVANFLADSVTLLSNNGAGVFGPSATPLPVGRGPLSVAAVDLNTDGLVDLAVSNGSSSNLAVLLNAGGGRFQPPTSFGVAKFPAVQSYSVTPGDFDGDGILDLAVANGPAQTVAVLSNRLSAGPQHVVVAEGQAVANVDFGSRPANQLPTLSPITDPAAIWENAGQQTILLTGISAGLGEAQPLAVTAASSDPTLVPHPAVAYVAGATFGSLTYNPAADGSGAAVITVTVEDGGPDGNLDTAEDNARLAQSFVVNVVSRNQPPRVAQAVSDQVAVENTNFAFAVAASTFTDPDADDQLTYSARLSDGGVLPNWLSFDAATRKFSGKPPFDANATDDRLQVAVIARDSGNLTAEAAFTLLVRENPRPWQNPVDRLDVLPDGNVTPADVLAAINFLNGHGAIKLPLPPSAQGPPPYLDVDGDGWSGPRDVLAVINYLNGQGAAGEGERHSVERPDVDQAALVDEVFADLAAWD